MSINVDKAFDVDNDGIVIRDDDGNVQYYLCTGNGDPSGSDAPINTFYFDNDTQLIHYKYGAGNNDWRQLRAQDITYDDSVSMLGEDEVQGAINKTKEILDALPDALPVLQARFATVGVSIPGTYASIPFSTVDVNIQSDSVDINPGDNTEIRLKESGAYICGYTTTIFDDNNPANMSMRAYANGTTEVPGSYDETGEQEAGNGSSSLEVSNQLNRTFIYNATANDTIEIQWETAAGHTNLTPVTFWAVKLDAQFANFQISDGAKNRAELNEGGITELVSGVNQSVSGTATTIVNWNNQDLVDVEGCVSHTIGSSEIVLNKTGKYKIHSKINIQRTANGRVQPTATWESAPSVGAFTSISKSISHAYTRSSDASNFGDCTGYFTVSATAGDRLRCGVANNEAPAVCDILGDRTNVIIEFIGDAA